MDDMNDFYSSIGIPDMTGNGDINVVDALLYEDMIRDTEAALGQPVGPNDPLYDPFLNPYSAEQDEDESESDDDTDSVIGGFTYGGYGYESEPDSDDSGDYFSGSGSDPDSMDFDFSFPLDPHDSY